jgi:hypothetical protein
LRLWRLSHGTLTAHTHLSKAIFGGFAALGKCFFGKSAQLIVLLVINAAAGIDFIVLSDYLTELVA